VVQGRWQGGEEGEQREASAREGLVERAARERATATNSAMGKTIATPRFSDGRGA
jgi:hypothetical protein